MNHRLCQAIESACLTDRKLAYMADVNERSIDYYKHGRVPTLPIAIRIAEAVGGKKVDTEYLKYLFHLDTA